MAEANVESELVADHTESVKDEFLQVYKEIGDKLSVDLFSDYLKLLENEDVIVKTETAVLLFRSFLIDGLSTSFERMWHSQNISQNLALLEQLKEHFKNTTEPQWRPSGHSAAEQTRPLRIKVLDKRIKYLEGKLAEQKQELETIVPQIESYRQVLAEHAKRRQRLSGQIDLRMEQLPVAKEKITQEILAAVEKL